MMNSIRHSRNRHIQNDGYDAKPTREKNLDESPYENRRDAHLMGKQDRRIAAKLKRSASLFAAAK